MIWTSLIVGWRFTPAHYQELVLSVYFDFIEAIAAINGSTCSRFERDLSIFATLRAFYREHLAGRPVAAAIVPVAVAIGFVPLCFPLLTARGATFRLIGKAQ
jgi:hypothetical protein